MILKFTDTPSKDLSDPCQISTKTFTRRGREGEREGERETDRQGFPETGADQGTVHTLITWLSCPDHVTAHALMTWLFGH